MELKAEWLATRKQQIVNQMMECDAQAKQLIKQVMSENSSKNAEIEALKEGSRKQGESLKDEIGKYLIQIKTFEAMILSKQDSIENLKAENAKLLISNQEKAVTTRQSYARIIELQHLLQVQRTQKEKYTTQSMRIIQQNEQNYIRELSRLKKEGEDALNNQQQRLSKAHQQELAQIKKNNMLLLQKIEGQYQSLGVKTSENSKQTESECARLVSENNKLLIAINEYKMKNMTLESTVNSLQQQIKITQKQLQMVKENTKRQNTFLKQQRNSLSDKNKRLAEKVEQLSWKNRENELKKDEDIKKIRSEVDKSFDQIIAKSDEEVRRLQDINKGLKGQIKNKVEEVKQLQQISLRLKEICEQHQKQINQLKQEKQKIKRQSASNDQATLLKANEQLKNEVVRKKCEIQVLQDEIKRLKIKVNNAANALQDYNKHKDIIQKQNKMLLSQIIFLKDKQKKGKGKINNSRLNMSNLLSEINSEQSRDQQNIQQYKKIIQYMTEEMTEVSKQLMQKNAKIERLQALVKRYERELKELS